MNFSNLVNLHTFNVFPEYFIGTSALYILIVIVLVSYNIYGLIVQKFLSECLGLILLLVCYLVLNDDLLFIKNGSDLVSILGFYKVSITDCFSFFTKFLVCLFSALYFFIVADFLKDHKLVSFEYLFLILLAVLGLMLLCSSNDLLVAYLSIELVTLSSYTLAAFRKTSNSSAEAGVKYLIIGAISSAFFLLGSSFVYCYTGAINVTDFSLIVSSQDWYNPSLNSIFLEPFLEIGLALILFSLFIKLSLAPFHMWSLDVYEGSPTISTFFFAVVTKLSFFVFLIRISYVAFFKYHTIWQFYGVTVALFSIFLGSFGGLLQKKLKTLLVYSSVGHMGYTLFAFSAGSLFGIEVVLFYLLIYMISGLSIWFIMIVKNQMPKKIPMDKASKELGSLVLLRKSNAALSVSLALAMFSTAGVPPLIGFFAKMGVLLSVLHAKYYFSALLAVLCSVVSTFYYIRIVKVLYFENVLVGKLYLPIYSSKVILVSFSVFLLMYFFVIPTNLYLLIYEVVYLGF